MVRRYVFHGLAVIAVALLALLIIRLHSAGGATSAAGGATEGRRLAEAWCKACHVIDVGTASTAGPAPDFAAVANQPSTTELSLKVFLGTNHRNMPDLILTTDQADALVRYILSLKRN